MKLLTKLLNFSWRHRKTARRFNNGGVIQRILYLLFMIIFITCGLVLLNISLNMFFNDKQLGAILFVILVVCFLVVFLELSIVYSVFSFKMASSGYISNRYIDAYETEPIERKCPKALDILFGFLYLLLAILLLLVGYFLLSKHL